MCVSQWKKRLNKIGLGKLSYAVVALDRLKKDRPTKLTVTLPDGRKQMFEKTLFVAFMNLPYEAAVFDLPRSVRDGWLHRYRDSAPYVSFEGGVAVAESVFWETYGSKRNYDHSESFGIG